MVLIFQDSLETQNHIFTPFHKWLAVFQFIFALIDNKLSIKYIKVERRIKSYDRENGSRETVL
jgi:hypothetical protein